ncbi:MAG: hypothetical protein JWO38_1643 [Gemmataceae bacterium]|nr:hypothetical protein [Gemmataceae bacterium]
MDPASDPIRVEAGYDDDTPAEKAKVTVTDAAGNPVAAGVLDERGVWTFPKPGPGSYTVVVEITGHRDAVRLEVPEAAAPVVYSGWRLDKRLGLGLGLGLLLGGTLAVVYLRRLARTCTCAN